MAYLSKYGVARKIRIPMVKRAVVDHAVGADWTPAAGDVKISKDGGAAANVTNLPTAIAMGNSAIWEFSLTAAEMSAAQINVTVADSATKAVEDTGFDIETYGNAAGQHQVDLADSVRAGLTALPNAAAEAAGGLYTRGAGAGQIAQTTNGTIDTAVTRWGGNAVAATVVNGVPIVDVKYFLGTAITEGGAGRIAGAVTKFFDKAAPTGTINSLPDAVPGAAGGLLIDDVWTDARAAKLDNLDADFTDEELAKLPPAERAALEEPLSESEERLAKGGPGIEHVDPNAKKEEAEPEPKVEAKPAAAPAKAAPAAADPDTPEDTPDTSASERKPFAVPYQAPAVDPAKVKAELDALDQKYEDGEITLRQRDDSRDAINRAVLKAEVASESEEQVRKGLWFSEVDRFVEKNPVYKDDVLYNALDREVRKIASDPKNADLKDHEVLGKAHEHLATRFKVDSGKPVAKDPVKELRLKREADLSGVPTTLTGLPNASGQASDSDEFAQLDDLLAKAGTGDAEAASELERQTARLTEAQKDRWARAA
jgi:hypothetical protein